MGFLDLKRSKSISSEDSNETDHLLNTRKSINNLRKNRDSIEIINYQDTINPIGNNNINDSNPFIDPIISDYWNKIYTNCQYECRFHFDPFYQWNKSQESDVLNKLDWKVTLLACFMFVGLQIDRGNISQAVSDNMLEDLGLTTQDYNYGNSLSKLAFLLAEIPSGIICKKIGADVWLPFQMCLWSIVAIYQGFLQGKTDFYITRVLIAMLEGGFIPQIVLWLSYFFTSKELSIKLSYFWSSSAITQCLCGVLAYFILRMRGICGLEGWRWLFMIEGFISLIIGIMSFFLMVPSVVETKRPWNKEGWFTYDEEKIIVNRVLRDDPSKGDMHNREGLSIKAVWSAITDYDLWPVYVIGLVAFIPVNTVTNYFTLNLKAVGYNTFDVNLLTIPFNVFHIVFLIGITKLSELVDERSLVELISPIWALPCLAILRWWSGSMENRFGTFIVSTILLSQPYIHAINVGWVSRNSNSIKTRSISSALYNMVNQTGGLIAANVYQMSDAPKYKRGNEGLFWLSVFTMAWILLTKGYYMWRNHSREVIWTSWDFEQKEFYINNTKDEGNKRLDFRFAH